MGRDAADSSTPGDQFNADQPGYETTDVNVNGVAVFLAGLFGSVLIFFAFCFLMGRFINNFLQKQDGNTTKWHIAGNSVPPQNHRQDLSSNATIQQQQLKSMIDPFPSPRLDSDDGNASTSDLHAREDLLLEHYSKVEGQPDAVRIPIERAMELIAQRGLPVVNQGNAQQPATSLAEANKPEVHAPLTTGFARTAFELGAIEAREQQMTYGNAEASAKAEK